MRTQRFGNWGHPGIRLSGYFLTSGHVFRTDREYFDLVATCKQLPDDLRLHRNQPRKIAPNEFRAPAIHSNPQWPRGVHFHCSRQRLMKPDSWITADADVMSPRRIEGLFGQRSSNSDDRQV